MSGRDAEPIAAFFPSIDRSLMRDLDRHLRNPEQAGRDEQTALQEAAIPQTIAARPQGSTSRPTVETIVEAVEQAASTITSMTERIRAFEQEIEDLQRAHGDTTTQLAEAIRRADDMEATLRAERERGARAETLAAHHVARANRLDHELGKALSDLTRVTEAIAGTLGLPNRPS